MNAILTLESGSSDLPATRFCLTAGKYILGRSSSCDLVVKHKTVSRRHAEIIPTRQKISLRDIGSRNGIFIDETRVLTAELQVGQYVEFGNVLFRLGLSQPVQEEPESKSETASCMKPNAPMAKFRAVLSKAQRRVFDLILKGLGEKQIAEQLHLSPTTIHNHIQAIYRVFNVHSRPELLVRIMSKNDDPNAMPP